MKWKQLIAQKQIPTMVTQEGASVDVEPGVQLTVLVPPRKLQPQFLAAVNPQAVVLFVGSGALEKPSAEFLQVLDGTTLLKTDERGSVQVMVDGETVRMKTEK